MSKEKVEAALMRSDRDANVHRILSLEREAAVEDGENYSFLITRLRMKVLLQNGRVVKRSAVLKELVTSGAQSVVAATGYMWQSSSFSRETKMYTVVLKEMELMIAEQEENDGILWCNLYGNIPSQWLLFEDLKVQGFRNVKRNEGLDLAHGLLAMKSLGRFHAMAKVVEERGIVNSEDYGLYSFATREHSVKSLTFGAFRNMVDAISEIWGPEWSSRAQMLKYSQQAFWERLQKLGLLNQARFNVVLHGDLWANNMMFKYDDANRPYDMRFLDFQLVHYNSSCWDVTHALYLSVNPHVRRQNYDLLVSAYTESLLYNLDRYGYDGHKPCLGSIQEEMDRLSFFGHVMLIGFHPLLATAEGTAMNIDKIMATGGTEGFNYQVFRKPYLKERLQEDINRAITKGVFLEKTQNL